MENVLTVNKTPIRTSRNFHANNVNLKGVCLPESIGEFKSVVISGDTADINLAEKLTYGLGDTLEQQVQKNANVKIGFELENEDKQVLFEFDKDNLTLVDSISIHAKRNSKATVIVRYESKADIKAFHNGIIRLEAEENACVKVVIVNLMSGTSDNFLAVENKVAKSAKVVYTVVDFGGKNSVTNFYTDLEGENADSGLYTMYLGKGDEVLDLNYIVHLKGKGSNADIEVQGALKDRAVKNFKGTLDFKTCCKKARGSENEACIMLSDTARSLALPMLLCSEEDVEGSHSTSSGKIGNKELFYLMSRGFSQKEAMKLLVRAKFNNILETIDEADLREQILNEVDERLD